MSKRDEVREQALKIATRILDPEWHYEGYPAKAEILVDQILAIDGIAIVELGAELPAFARVDVEGKPEVGRYYDGYKDGQEDMLKTGWVKKVRDEKSNQSS